MRLLPTSATRRLATVLGFVLACGVFFSYMWSQSGGTVPGFSSQRSYHVSALVDDVDNMAPFSDIQTAGVNIGKVANITPQSGKIRLDLELDDSTAPLHEGATVQVSEKSLAGQTYLNLTDGHGQPYPDAAMLPPSAVKPSVQLRDVLASLDKPTRDALGSTVRALGTGTNGRARDISSIATGLAKLGRNGHTTLDAVAAQTDDLKSLTREMNTVFTALDTGNGQIADMVGNANQITAATAGQREALHDTMQRLPGTLNRLQGAADSFTDLAPTLQPVAADLRQAAPGLASALTELPATTSDMRGMLPSLNTALGKAPATLQRVPAVSADAQALMPQVHDVMRDLNPMLRYLRPYGRDIAQFPAVFDGVLHHYSETGNASYVYLKPFVNPHTVRGNPLLIDNGGKGLLPMRQTNPYPAPGGLAKPVPFTGPYPRVHQDPP